ncbi:hypothetical protein [Maribacter sp. 2308TA10-17]|uniref:hypothetical protein n=1 Tax=Maribacter sp. 2308TA10-17 TaxID=3386276 RepID=UPI0039BC566D
MSSAQSNLNEYKYVIIPKRFEGFKKENQHQTSTLIKHLFAKKGFITVYDDYPPDDLNSNRCLGLFVDLINNSSMFTTKTALTLKDCNNQEIFTSQEGKSKKKDYKAAYAEAITKAFDSFASLDYSYESKDKVTAEEPVVLNFENDVKTVEDAPKKDENEDSMVKQIATREVQYYEDRRPVESNFKKAPVKEGEKMEKQNATLEEQSFESMEPIETDFKKRDTDVSSRAKISKGILYAQAVNNGYQLVDSTPKIQLKIFKSSMPNVYIAKGDNKDGVVYTSDGKWFFEYSEGEQIIKEELDIKF